MRQDVPTAAENPETRTSSPHRSTLAAPGDAFAAWALRGPLAVALVVVIAAQLATWAPHYLRWPYWADHDVFANAARAWDDGLRPYRDVRCNQFPAAIYLYYGLGTLAGWDRTWPLFAFDAALLVGLGGLLVAWSRRMFGRSLPGLVGLFAFQSYYLGLDYCHVAQRDWHASAVLVAGILAAEMAPGRVGRLISAVAAAVAVSFRPQVVLLMPAVLLAIDEGARRQGEPWGRTALAVAEWAAVFAACLALAFAPLLAAGVMGDFLRALRLVSYGGRYNLVTPASIVRGWMLQAGPMRWWVVPAAILLLGRGGDPGPRRTARTWLVALAGASLYKPLSPMAHSYLDIPPLLCWSINLAVLIQFLLTARRPSPSLQLAGVVLAMGLGPSSLHPDCCVIGPSARALGLLPPRPATEDIPPGYRRGSVPTSAAYPWRDYRAALDYLRAHTAPGTKVANALKWDPAVVSMIDRPSAFPAESITWLRMVNPDEEEAFARALEGCGDSVVVWDPDRIGPDPKFKLERLTAAIRRHYRPEARFGDIAVWRRMAE
jgi:hypothetical protein